MPPVGVFVSYAHEDEGARDTLNKFCAMLRRQGLVSLWSDQEIPLGCDWASEIDTRLNSAEVIVLLVTAAFIHSDYCFGIEMQRALDRHKAGEAVVVPVIVSPCDWEEAPFGRLQALPTGAKAMTTWPDPDEAWTVVAKGLRRVMESMRTAGPSAERSGLRSVDNENSHRQIAALAREYEWLRLRMQKGAHRTVCMETVFLKMRASVCTAWPLISELANSPSPGERLCAVAMLQIRPEGRYIDFLADCIKKEKPFIGHRAAIALQSYARLAPSADRSKVLPLVEDVLKVIGLHADSERAALLRGLRDELKEGFECPPPARRAHCDHFPP